MANPYLLCGAPLRTGLGVPETRHWEFCKVVVQRPHAQKDSFTVKLSQHELANATNDCLFRAVTAHVPFAEWERVDIYVKHIDTSIVQGRRSVHPFSRWPMVRTWTAEQDTDATEECARDQLADLQYELYLKCIEDSVDQKEEWTIVIYVRTQQRGSI